MAHGEAVVFANGDKGCPRALQNCSILKERNAADESEMTGISSPTLLMPQDHRQSGAGFKLSPHVELL